MFAAACKNPTCGGTLLSPLPCACQAASGMDSPTSAARGGVPVMPVQIICAYPAPMATQSMPRPGIEAGTSDLQSDALPTELSRLVVSANFMMLMRPGPSARSTQVGSPIKVARLDGRRARSCRIACPVDPQLRWGTAQVAHGLGPRNPVVNAGSE